MEWHCQGKTYVLGQTSHSGHHKTLTDWPGIVPDPPPSHDIAHLYNTILKVMFNISNIFHVFRNATRKTLIVLGTSRCQEYCKNCRYRCNENQLDAIFILSLFRQSTSTCFGHIFSPSSGGMLYMYNSWYMLYIYSIPPDDGLQICPKHVEVDWRNKLRINITSSWFLLRRYIEMHGQQT